MMQFYLQSVKILNVLFYYGNIVYAKLHLVTVRFCVLFDFGSMKKITKRIGVILKGEKEIVCRVIVTDNFNLSPASNSI